MTDWESEEWVEGNRERVCFLSDGGDLIEGDVIDKVKLTHPTFRLTVTILTAKGEERFTFRTEAAWKNAIGQQELFPREVNLGSNSNSNATATRSSRQIGSRSGPGGDTRSRST